VLARLRGRKILVVLSGVQPQPSHVLERAGIEAAPGELELVPTLARARSSMRASTRRRRRRRGSRG
jgi:hypothetical protein